MKECGAQSQAAKQSGTTNGETWPQFLAQCRQQLATSMGGVAAPVAPSSGVVPASTGQSVMKQCGAQWQAAKTAGTTNGQTWPQFLRDCRARTASTGAPSQGGFAPAAPAPAPAPTQQGSSWPWQQPAAPAPAPARSSYGAPAAGAASAEQVQSRCLGATVVWVNEHSHIYHFPGTRDFGNTKRGEYMCEADAQAAGNRAAKNERHP